MLIRQHDDSSSDERLWRTFVHEQGFGHLAACGVDRPSPVVVPTQFVLMDDSVVLHLARANPLFECLEENPRCVLSVAGDWAYVPGEWKVIDGEDPRSGIPTTYYAAVQLSGSATIADDPLQVAQYLEVQLDALEPHGDYIEPIDHGPKLKAIRAIVIDVDDVRAKFKYGGNVGQLHRDNVANQLRRRGGPGDAAALRQMTRVFDT